MFELKYHPCTTLDHIQLYHDKTLITEHIVEKGQEGDYQGLVKDLKGYILNQCSDQTAATYLLSDNYFTVTCESSSWKLSELYASKKEDEAGTRLGLFDTLETITNEYNHFYLSKNPNVGLLMTIDSSISDLYKFDGNGQMHSGDNCGINLLIPSDLTIMPNAKSFAINHLVCGEAHKSHGYLLMPRSSIAKTESDTLRQSNCVGLIEPSYRGHLITKVDNLSDDIKMKKRGESITQIVMPNLRTNWTIQRVLKLSTTQRGTGGFGSTGK